MGDLSELMASVAEKGIIEPLVVRQRGGRYQIIAGERRYHAAVQVGLRDVPVVVREVDDVEVMETGAGREPAAQGPDGVRGGRGAAAAGAAVQLHARGHGAEAGEVAHLDHGIAVADQHARRGPQPMSAGRHHVEVDAPADRPAGRPEEDAGAGARSSPPRAEPLARMFARRRRPANPGVPRPFAFKFRPQTKAFDLRLSFKKTRVDKHEIIDALEAIIKELRAAR